MQSMAFLKLSYLKFLHRPKPAKSSANQRAAGQATVSNSVPRPKSVAELELELEEEQRLLAQSIQPIKTVRRRSPVKAIMGIGLIIGVPVGIIYLVNLPYAAIRRPVAATAPVLLLPSYISLDHHYRLAITTFQQAQQLIDNATTPADLALGEQRLDQAQMSLDAIPIDWVNGPSYSAYGSYNWQFSLSRFNATRADVGRLKAKVFQEKNAQTALLKVEKSLVAVQQQYPQAKTAADRQMAIAQWQTALDQLQQIPDETLAGQTAQQNLLAYERDFQEVVGLTAGNERTLAVLDSAREYSQRAAMQGQNPPHTAEEWQQIVQLWEEAIAQVERISEDDPRGYAEANKMRAEYQKNLGQIVVRLEAEQASVRDFEQAQQKTAALLERGRYSSRSETTGQLQSIIDQLKRIQPGTTVYSEAQADLLSAQNKLDQFKL
jgi:hypothetical protein